MQLATEYDRLKEFMRTRIDKYVDQFRDKLTALWDKCLLSQRERDEFVEMLHDKGWLFYDARAFRLKWRQKTPSRSLLTFC